MTDVSLFDYHLPTDRIAQTPLEQRDQAKLLVLERVLGKTEDKYIYDLPTLLHPGDLVVMNNSKVFKARLRAQRSNGQTIEIFLLRPQHPLSLPLRKGEKGGWLALAKPTRHLRIGERVTLADGSSVAILKKNEDGTILLDFQKTTEEIFALAEKIGEIPTPPYVKTRPSSPDQYQTIYASKIGSVAAPTAGFHFTPKLLEKLTGLGIKQAFVTLHVGLGTFRPMKSATLEEHMMHEEWIHVPEETLQAIRDTKDAGHRVIAIGTTTVRALESAAQRSESTGFTNLFITPGYSFKVIDGLLTNFHLPKSTLLVLVSAFAGRKNVLNAYQHAIDHGYRFYSFGDAMLII